MTNFEKIKEEMTIEKTARKMADYYDCDICPCVEFCKTSMGSKCSEIFEKWLKKEVDVLDEVEKEYLKNLLAPWLKRKNSEITITKMVSIYDKNTFWLDIDLLDNDDVISLPNFHSKKMYAGMREDKPYSVEELGLR